ncbi:MAG: hypothetical protein LC650_00520 [Actinobacteria bacterium]|nr:hypothetical protein [Actinomycetota bacterium]
MTMLKTDFKIPCIKCGRLLEGDGDPIKCACGVEYSAELVDSHREPGYYREWLAALGCTCGRVEIGDSDIVITRHRCRSGGIGMMNRNN